MKETAIQELLDGIRCADAGELNDILSVATERFREHWPNWDLMMISCEGRTPEAHIKTLEKSLRLLTVAAKNGPR